MKILVDKLPASCDVNDCIFRSDKWCNLIAAQNAEKGKHLNTFIANYGYEKKRCPDCPLETFPVPRIKPNMVVSEYWDGYGDGYVYGWNHLLEWLKEDFYMTKNTWCNGLDLHSNVLGNSVSLTIFVDEKDLFCGTPYMYVCQWHESNEVGIKIRDEDDFDLGMIYKCQTKEEQQSVFTELINYIYDLQNTRVPFQMILGGTIFPDLGIERKGW